MPGKNPDSARVSERCTDDRPCTRCKQDLEFLQRKQRPQVLGSNASTIQVVDLFAGCGGMSAGLLESARRLGMSVQVPLAVDSDRVVLNIFTKNLPAAQTKQADVGKLFDGEIGAKVTSAERETIQGLPEIHILVGGPPCQGHSDLNNHTRRDDPKNALYLRMARAAEVLLPQVVIIENVATVRRDKSDVAQRTIDALTSGGYTVASAVIELQSIGVPQRRHRFVVLASRTPRINPARVMSELRSHWAGHPLRTVKWAIHDLLDCESDSTFDSASARSAMNVKRMAYLFDHGVYDLPNTERPECHQDGNHSYKSVYGRLRWFKPAQTITTGFGSMGQGRYVHPQRRRTLTPHEAARLQTFPDWFDFGKAPRGVLAKAIGNAVPPFLTLQLGQIIIPSLVIEGTSAASA